MEQFYVITKQKSSKVRISGFQELI